jgi:hypothetical protein
MIEYNFSAIKTDEITTDMLLNRIDIETVVSCVYNFDETIIMFGEYVDKSRELTIKKISKLQNKSVKEVHDILIELNCRSVIDNSPVWDMFNMGCKSHIFTYLKTYYEFVDNFDKTKDSLFLTLKRNKQIKNNEIVKDDIEVQALQQLVWVCEFELQGVVMPYETYFLNTLCAFYHRLGLVTVANENSIYSRILNVPHRNYIDLDSITL